MEGIIYIYKKTEEKESDEETESDGEEKELAEEKESTKDAEETESDDDNETEEEEEEEEEEEDEYEEEDEAPAPIPPPRCGGVVGVRLGLEDDRFVYSFATENFYDLCLAIVIATRDAGSGIVSRVIDDYTGTVLEIMEQVINKNPQKNCLVCWNPATAARGEEPWTFLCRKEDNWKLMGRVSTDSIVNDMVNTSIRGTIRTIFITRDHPLRVRFENETRPRLFGEDIFVRWLASKTTIAF